MYVEAQTTIRRRTLRALGVHEDTRYQCLRIDPAVVQLAIILQVNPLGPLGSRLVARAMHRT